MKTNLFTFIRLVIALLSVMAMLSQDVMAQGFTPDLFPGQTADRTAFEVSATVKVGDYKKAPNTNSYVTDLASTNESVVQTYNQTGHTVVLIVGVGTADVTYSEQMYHFGDNGVVVTDGEPTHHTIHYTVEKGQAVATCDGREGPVTDFRLIWDGVNPNITSGCLPTFPNPQIIIKQVYMMQNKYPEMINKYLSPSEFQWELSNPSVATINSGNIYPVSYGTTKVHVSWPGDDNWIGASVDFNLTVEAPKQNIYINFPQTQITGFVGESMSAQPNVSMYTIDRWYSENPQVASVDETTGEVQFNSVGTTRIFAEMNETAEHYKATGYYTVTVQKRKADLSFEGIAADGMAAYAELGVPFTPPTLINPHNLPISGWNSSVPSVAEVNSNGEVTINGVGSTYITCAFSGNDAYEAGTAGYQLIVSTIGIQVLGISVTGLNADDVLGDGQKKVTFDTQTRTLNLNGWVIDAAGLDVAMSGVIVDTNNKGGSLKINLTGDCSIINANRCIVTGGGLLLISDGNAGSLTLTANKEMASNAIIASDVKIHECSVSATASSYAVLANNEVSLSKNSRLYAESTTEKGSAIHCVGFSKDDGIDILTPGVHFAEKLGFFTDENNKVEAQIVEIGKKPIVVAEDEETVIEFTTEDPEGNESVVFSATANDTFNEETGQLEISTSLTDEQVTTALETLIPGSSAWCAMLPGSLTFDVPAGKGEIQVECLTLPGYTLKLLIEGKGSVSLTQSETFGWAKVSYDVAAPTHVVIYLHAESSSARGFGASNRAPEAAGAYIKAVKIVPEGVVPTSIDTVKSENTVDGKYLINGRLHIIHNGRTYGVTGIEIK